MKKVIYSKPLKVRDDLPLRSSDNILVAFDNDKVVGVERLTSKGAVSIMNSGSASAGTATIELLYDNGNTYNSYLISCFSNPISVEDIELEVDKETITARKCVYNIDITWLTEHFSIESLEALEVEELASLLLRSSNGSLYQIYNIDFYPAVLPSWISGDDNLCQLYYGTTFDNILFEWAASTGFYYAFLPDEKGELEGIWITFCITKDGKLIVLEEPRLISVNSGNWLVGDDTGGTGLPDKPSRP